jgi:small ligand-binding sensory domain FIST
LRLTVGQSLSLGVELLLVLASAVFMGSESFGTRDHILLSVLRLPTSSPPTTGRVTVGVVDHSSTRVSVEVKVKVTLVLTVSQSVSLGYEPHLGFMTRYLLLFDSYGLLFVEHPL